MFRLWPRTTKPFDKRCSRCFLEIHCRMSPSHFYVYTLFWFLGFFCLLDVWVTTEWTWKNNASEFCLYKSWLCRYETASWFEDTNVKLLLQSAWLRLKICFACSVCCPPSASSSPPTSPPFPSTPPPSKEGKPGMSDVTPLFGFSGLSFDSHFPISPLLLFCLVQLLSLSCVIFLLMIHSPDLKNKKNSQH